MIYLDNAATTWPKPESVYRAADLAAREYGGNPGRSGHRLSLMAGKAIEEARLLTSALFGIPKPERLIFFTLNCTDSLNLALKGLLAPGDHVITGCMEHNSVARPLEALKAMGIEYTKAPTSPVTGVDIDAVKASIKKNTKLMVFSHVSNVTGTLNPIYELGKLCLEYGISFLVDAAQSAGSIPIDIARLNIDMLAFPGHKGLLGPSGTGGLYIREGLSINPQKQGGTGSRSELLTQPEHSPDRFESGTPNTPGLAGLAAGVRHLQNEGIENIRAKEAKLANRLIEGLTEIKGVSIFGPPAGKDRCGVVSIGLEGIDNTEAAFILDSSFDIAVRAGLHCAPDAHAVLGTIKSGGTLRISIGSFNSEKDIDACVRAIAELA